MTKDELKTQASELVDAAWMYGHAEGANEAAEAHAKELAEKQEEVEAAYKKGKEEGEKPAATVPPPTPQVTQQSVAANEVVTPEVVK